MDFTLFQPVEAGFRQLISFDAIDERQYQIPGRFINLLALAIRFGADF